MISVTQEKRSGKPRVRLAIVSVGEVVFLEGRVAVVLSSAYTD